MSEIKSRDRSDFKCFRCSQKKELSCYSNVLKVQIWNFGEKHKIYKCDIVLFKVKFYQILFHTFTAFDLNLLKRNYLETYISIDRKSISGIEITLDNLFLSHLTMFCFNFNEDHQAFSRIDTTLYLIFLVVLFIFCCKYWSLKHINTKRLD